MGGTETPVILACTPTLSLSLSVSFSLSLDCAHAHCIQLFPDRRRPDTGFSHPTHRKRSHLAVCHSLGSIIHNLCCFRVQCVYLARSLFRQSDCAISKTAYTGPETRKIRYFSMFALSSFLSIYHLFPPPINPINKNK